MNWPSAVGQAAMEPANPQGMMNAETAGIPDGRKAYPEATLNERGMILNCNDAFENLFGFDWRNLVWQHISWLFPHFSAEEFAQASETTPTREYLMRCGQLHWAQNRYGEPFSCNLIFVRAMHEGESCLRMTVIPSADAQV